MVAPRRLLEACERRHALRRRLLPLCVAVLAAAGCAATAPAAQQDVESILAARERLGPPTVELAEALLTTRDALDRARHDVSRGPDMLAEVEVAEEGVARVGVAAVAATRATEDGHAQAVADGPSPSREAVGRAEAVLAAAAARALEGAAAATEELTQLRRLAQADQAMDAVVAGWDAAGSATERRAALSSAASDLDHLAAELAAAPAVPPGCPALRDHRVAWASLAAARSRELAGAATSATGSTYDRLRASYGAAPYNVDRLAADAGDRPCWESASAVTASAADVRSAVAHVQAALSPPT